MNNENKKEFASLWTAMAEKYSKPMSKAVLALEFETLKPYPLEAVQAAAMAHMRESKWMPQASELIERMNPPKTAKEVWQEVFAMIGQVDPDTGEQYSSYHAPKFDEVTATALRNIGGWRAVCQTPLEEQQWLQKRFEEHYGTAETVSTALISRERAGELLDGFEQKRLN